jgi:hypothetical protein
MVTDRGRKRLPPYISYRLFRNFLERLLQQGVPARIDRSYWERIGLLSGSSGTQLMAALRYLNLIDENGRPLERLKPLVLAKGEQRTALLREIARDCFGFALQGSLDPGSATYQQLEEIFVEKFQLDGQLSRKCLKFFCEISKDAGLQLSPYILERFHSGHRGEGADVITKRNVARNRSITKRPVKKSNQNSKVPLPIDDQHEMESMEKQLLAKFPTFDPGWPDDVKSKWFTSYDEMLRLILARNEK